MNKEYFTDNLSVEIIAEFTDKMLKFEKKAKYRNIIKKELFKIVPAVAVIAFVVGAVNILPVFLNNTAVLPENEVAESATSENIITPGMMPAPAIDKLTDIPRIVEKSVFESLVANIPEGRGKDRMNAYYALRDAFHPTVSSLPFLEKGAFYIFDPRSIEREITEILAYWNQYIGWTDTEYHQMLADYGLGENELALVMEWDNVYYEGYVINLAEINSDDETITFQGGRFIITTPIGQEPYQNDDGTITIPGSGTFAFEGIMRIANPNGYHSFDHGNSTFTVPDGIVINIINKADNKPFTNYGADAVIDLLLPDNIGKEVIVERDVDGEPFKAVYDKDRNATWNDVSAYDYSNTSKDMQSMESEHKIIFQNNGNITIDGKNIESAKKPDNYNNYTFEDGTKIEVGNYFFINGTYKLEADPEIKADYLKSFIFKIDTSCWLLMPRDKTTVKLANGTVIEAPGSTTFSAKIVADDDYELEIIVVGDGDAIITKPDGTKTTAKCGTILDNKGNVVK